jgi:DNA-binding XRE family transcriptional regulator
MVSTPRTTWAYLSHARETAGYASQTAFGVAVGVSQRTVSDWETGRKCPEYRMWRKIAQVLNVELRALGAEIADFWA